MNFSEFISQIYWRPRIGDPTFMGWLTVAAYGLATILCFVAAMKSSAAAAAAADGAEARRNRRMWKGVAVLMAFLCVNKQLDLQSLLTNVGRIIATQGGWYEQRRTIQLWFVIAIGMVGVAAFAFLAWKTRSVLRGRILLLIGLSMLLLFVIMRAASFHHVGVFLGWQVLGLKLNWLLELGSIALVAVSAAQVIRRHPS